jgi:cyclophilin family peptidyl-prolyl cis-trans isomerase
MFHQIFMKKILIFLGLFSTLAQAQKVSGRDYLVTIKTPFGEMKAILYDQTPLHKANFIKLAKDDFYDDLLFHRIIDGFMIQGGDPDSRFAKAGVALGNGGDEIPLVPAEFRPELFHRKGALAAARGSDPQKRSSGCQFYIVEGRVMKGDILEAQIKRSGRPATAAQREIYQTLGGSPHLDGAYTVFGQVISGLKVIDAISKQPRDSANRPLKDIKMKVSVKKIRKKKILKRYGYSFS